MRIEVVDKRNGGKLLDCDLWDLVTILFFRATIIGDDFEIFVDKIKIKKPVVYDNGN